MQEQQALKNRLKTRLRKVPGFRVARFIYSLVRSVESRNSALLLLRPPRGLYQPYGTTSDDRYPEIFQQVLERVGDEDGLRILSFGCATGEEVFSLLHYFQRATIVGLDINPLNIAVCRFRLRRIGDAKLHFAVAGSTIGEASASCGVIFAMAVFRHGDLNSSPPPPKCDHRIRFADFEQSMADLARTLKPGGLLVIQNAMFRFADIPVAAGFETAFSLKLLEGGPLYGRDNCILPDANYPDVVFRKIT
jgi:SAM-dependent methyltransferase